MTEQNIPDFNAPDIDINGDNMTIERFLPIPDFPDYMIGCNTGIYNIRTGNWITATDGRVQLRQGDKHTSRNIQTLVYNTFENAPDTVRLPDNLLGINLALKIAHVLRLLGQLENANDIIAEQDKRILELTEQAKPIKSMKFNHKIEIKLKDEHILELNRRIINLSAKL